jgi:PilZ domain-containing protein
MQPSPKERRTSPRRQQHRVRAQIRGPRQHRGTPLFGWIVDRSRGGLCLQLDQEVKVGTRLKVRPTSAPATLEWVPVVVKNRRRRQRAYVLGCEFVEVPPLVTLVLFG